jgi:hypothetical protein
MENIGAAYVVYTDENVVDKRVPQFLADFDREQEDLCFFFIQNLYKKDTLSCLLLGRIA